MSPICPKSGPPNTFAELLEVPKECWQQKEDALTYLRSALVLARESWDTANIERKWHLAIQAGNELAPAMEHIARLYGNTHDQMFTLLQEPPTGIELSVLENRRHWAHLKRTGRITQYPEPVVSLPLVDDAHHAVREKAFRLIAMNTPETIFREPRHFGAFIADMSTESEALDPNDQLIFFRGLQRALALVAANIDVPVHQNDWREEAAIPFANAMNVARRFYKESSHKRIQDLLWKNVGLRLSVKLDPASWRLPPNGPAKRPADQAIADLEHVLPRPKRTGFLEDTLLGWFMDQFQTFIDRLRRRP